jgi:hypothetical protein
VLLSLSALTACSSSSNLRAHEPDDSIAADATSLRPATQPTAQPTLYRFAGTSAPERYIVITRPLFGGQTTTHVLNLDITVSPFRSWFAKDETGQTRLRFALLPWVSAREHSGRERTRGGDRAIGIEDTGGGPYDTPEWEKRVFLSAGDAAATQTCLVETRTYHLAVMMSKAPGKRTLDAGLLMFRVVVRADGLVRYARLFDSWHSSGDARWSNAEPVYDQFVTVSPPVGLPEGQEVVSEPNLRRVAFPRLYVTEQFKVTSRPVLGAIERSYVMNADVMLFPFVAEFVTDQESGKTTLKFVIPPLGMVRPKTGAEREEGGDRPLVTVGLPQLGKVGTVNRQFRGYGWCAMEYMDVDITTFYAKTKGVTGEFGKLAFGFSVYADGFVNYRRYLSGWYGDGDVAWADEAEERNGGIRYRRLREEPEWVER